jgi:protein-S-isoprenylcysteine O-methyltransferase Ste14
MPNFKGAGQPNSQKWERAGSILAASFFSVFAIIYTSELLSTFRTSLLLMLIKESLDIGFFLSRKPANVVNFRPIPWLFALGGTVIPLMLVPSHPSSDSLTGETLQYIGIFCQIIAVLSLNRSLGIVPAIRDIKTHGTYRVVRHPLYLSYFISLTGFFISNVSLYNTVMLVLFVFLQLYRIQKEEELLSQDRTYVDYASHTKWKVIPFIY